MVPFQYSRVQDDTAAIEAGASGTRFLAGGTTLVDLMREQVEQPAALVDINRLAHRHVEMTARGLEIGTLARMSDVAADRAVAATYPVIAVILSVPWPRRRCRLRPSICCHASSTTRWSHTPPSHAGTARS